MLIYGINDEAGAEYFSWRLGTRVKWRERPGTGVRAGSEPAGASSLRDGSEVFGRSGGQGKQSADLFERRRPPVSCCQQTAATSTQARRIRARSRLSRVDHLWPMGCSAELYEGDGMKGNDKSRLAAAALRMARPAASR